MTYNIIDQKEEVMRYDFFSLRKEMNTKIDCLTCFVPSNKSTKKDRTHIYLKILRLEGEYRSSHNCWCDHKIKLNISYPSPQ